jgi:hypothetical protein
VRRAIRSLSVLAATVAFATVASPARAQESPRGPVMFGPDFGVLSRPADASSAPGATYGAGLAWGVHGQIIAAPWLRFAAYYLHGSQPVTFADGALGVPWKLDGSTTLSSYVLGARLEPTWSPTSRLHLWLSVGAAWGRTAIGAMHVSAPSPFDLASREGVLVEIPMGLGGNFDVIPRWLGAGFDATYGPVMSQTGDIYGDAHAIDASGRAVVAHGMPTSKSSLQVLGSLSLEL